LPAQPSLAEAVWEPAALALQTCIFAALALAGYHACALHVMVGADGPAIFVHAQTLFWAVALVVSVFLHSFLSPSFAIGTPTLLALFAALLSALANARALCFPSGSTFSSMGDEPASKDVHRALSPDFSLQPTARSRLLSVAIPLAVLAICAVALFRAPHCPTAPRTAPVMYALLDSAQSPAGSESMVGKNARTMVDDHKISIDHDNHNAEASKCATPPLPSPSPSPSPGPDAARDTPAQEATKQTADNIQAEKERSDAERAELVHAARAEAAAALADHAQRLLKRDKTVRKMTQLRSTIADIYAQLILPKKPVALFAVPRHWNLGDSFIWLGQKAVLDSLGLNLVYTCFDALCSKDFGNLSNVIRDGTIVIHGGGNYGDIYRFNNQLINKLLTRFPNNRVVQLPQSVFYRKMNLAVLDARMHFKHPNFFLMVRDQFSYDFMHKVFAENLTMLTQSAPYDTYSDRIVRCPDSAITIGPVLPNCEPDLDVVYLSRRDTEKVFNTTSMRSLLDGANLTYVVMDWMADWRRVFKMPLTQALPSSLAEFPLFRLHAANNMLCRGRVVLSDRLHASILALLMGRPFVGVDNVYGKMGRVVQMMFQDESFGTTLSQDDLNLYIADSPSEAVPRILSLLETVKNSPDSLAL
jgi:exopolysaccharide biosynthesis predicted pyruvyltransferase EpsI